VNDWLEELGRRYGEAAARRGVTIETPRLDPAIALELLELARVAAHTQERRFAPLASYLAGVAAERLRAAGGAADAETVAALIQEVRKELEREAPAV
jgi:hypothetical protein